MYGAPKRWEINDLSTPRGFHSYITPLHEGSTFSGGRGLLLLADATSPAAPTQDEAPQGPAHHYTFHHSTPEGEEDFTSFILQCDSDLDNGVLYGAPKRWEINDLSTPRGFHSYITPLHEGSTFSGGRGLLLLADATSPAAPTQDEAPQGPAHHYTFHHSTPEGEEDFTSFILQCDSGELPSSLSCLPL